jgi:Flp pilus assembly protein TadC
MPVLVILLIFAGVTAMAIAAGVLIGETSRRGVRDRALAVPTNVEIRKAVRKAVNPTDEESFRVRMLRKAPSAWARNRTAQSRLIQAGYDNPMAPLVYSMVRTVSLIGLPAIILGFVPQFTFGQAFVSLAGATLVGLMAPPFVLLRIVHARQERIRRALPDTLDLLVVCVEAGMSLDAALLRVARDLILAFPDLARELLIVSRKTNAGVTREDALRALWDRTGVEEVRSLVGSMVQSEKWGSSSSRVLRVSAETLRRKRRHNAERRAATAPVKMIIPMAIFIFPALFVVILGPALLQILSGFSGK